MAKYSKKRKKEGSPVFKQRSEMKGLAARRDTNLLDDREQQHNLRG